MRTVALHLAVYVCLMSVVGLLSLSSIDSRGMKSLTDIQGAGTRKLMQNPDFPNQRQGAGSSSSSSSYYSTTSTTSSSTSSNTQYGRRRLLSLAQSIHRKAAEAAQAIVDALQASYIYQSNCQATDCVRDVAKGGQRMLKQNPDFPAQRSDQSGKHLLLLALEATTSWMAGQNAEGSITNSSGQPAKA